MTLHIQLYIKRTSEFGVIKSFQILIRLYALKGFLERLSETMPGQAVQSHSSHWLI